MKLKTIINPFSGFLQLVNKFSVRADGNPYITNPLTLISGTNITLNQVGDTIEIEANSNPPPVLTGYILQEEYIATAGQVNFPLVGTPLDDTQVAVNVRGQWLTPGDDFTYDNGTNSVDVIGGVVIGSQVAIYFSTGLNGVTFAYEIAAGTGPNYALVSTPIDSSGIWLICDGGVVPKAYYTYDSGANEVVMNPGREFADGQKILILFQDGGSVLQSAQEVLTGPTNGSNLIFGALRFDPNEASSVILLRDGRRVPDAQFSIVGKSFVFTAGFAPAAGQKIEAIYYFGDGTNKEQTLYYTITQDQIDAKALQLDFIPREGSEVLFDTKSDGFQEYGVDFIVTGSTVSWDGLGFEGIVVEGSKVRFYFLI